MIDCFLHTVNKNAEERFFESLDTFLDGPVIVPVPLSDFVLGIDFSLAFSFAIFPYPLKDPILGICILPLTMLYAFIIPPCILLNSLSFLILVFWRERIRPFPMKQAILPSSNITVTIRILRLSFTIKQVIFEIPCILEIVVFIVSPLALLDAIDKVPFIVAVLAEMLLAEAVRDVILPTALVKVLFRLVF